MAINTSGHAVSRRDSRATAFVRCAFGCDVDAGTADPPAAGPTFFEEAMLMQDATRRAVAVVIGAAIGSALALCVSGVALPSRDGATNPLAWLAKIVVAGIAGAGLRMDTRGLHASHRILFAR